MIYFIYFLIKYYLFIINKLNKFIKVEKYIFYF